MSTEQIVILTVVICLAIAVGLMWMTVAGSTKNKSQAERRMDDDEQAKILYQEYLKRKK